MQKIIVGIDEAGRGPLAGPVVAAAFTILDTKYQLLDTSKLRDSKKFTPRAREEIYKSLASHTSVQWGIGSVSEKQIDKINIYQATRLAMKKAVLSLERKLQKRLQIPTSRPVPLVHDRELGLPVIDLLIVDGNMNLDLPIRQKAIVKADATVLQCMAASIVAKVTRDRLMRKLHKEYPVYGFDRHKGYGTANHMEMLKKHGPCPIHRFSFAPCK